MVELKNTKIYFLLERQPPEGTRGMSTVEILKFSLTFNKIKPQMHLDSSVGTVRARHL